MERMFETGSKLFTDEMNYWQAQVVRAFGAARERSDELQRLYEAQAAVVADVVRHQVDFAARASKMFTAAFEPTAA